MRKKILWCSDSSEAPTGYTNQTLYILGALSQYFECALLGHQHNSMVRQANSSRGFEPFTMFPGNYEGGTITAVVNNFKPQLVAWLCDPFMVPWISQKKKEWKDNPKTLFYFPMDSDDVYMGMEETLASVDYRVAFCRWSHNKLKKETGLDSYIIPHCVDVQTFQPLANREQIRKDNKLDGKFVIGMVGRNQSRKNPQRLLYILKIFFDNHPDAIALFHCDPYDPMSASGKVDMYKHAKEIGLNDHYPGRNDCPNCRLRFTGYNMGNQATPQTLNTIYNTFDVHALTTTGEGFGITTLEAMAAGVPNVLTDYTTTQELIVENGRCGEPVKWTDFVNGGYTTKRVLPNIDEFVAKLEKLYNKPELRNEYAQVGRQKAMRYYSTNAVLPQWIQLMSEILEKEELRCVV